MTTSLYLGILGLIYVTISLDTIKARRKNLVSLGTGKNDEIIHLVSAHENFSNYTPIFLIALFLLESQSFSIIALHLLSITFVLGRLLHYLTMKNKEVTFRHRKTAMMLTLWTIIASSLINIFLYMNSLGK